MPRGVYALRKNTGSGREWPDPVVSTLRTMLATGSSYNEIVAAVRKQHGFVTTKNALVGKANRLGLRSQNKMHNDVAIKDTLQRRKQDRRIKIDGQSSLLRDDNDPIGKTHGPGFKRKHKPEDIAEARKGHVPRIIEQKPATSKPFADLRRGECRWPTTDDCTMACGDKATVGSYCNKHAVLAYRTMPTRKRNAVIVKKQEFDRDADATIEHFLSVGTSGSPKITGEDEIDAFIAEHVLDD